MSWPSPECFECVEVLIAKVAIHLPGHADRATFLGYLNIQVMQIAHIGGCLYPALVRRLID